MVLAYYMSENVTDRKLPNVHGPAENLHLNDLLQKTGVLYFRIGETDWSSGVTGGVLKELIEKRCYKSSDVCEISEETLGVEFKAKTDSFYEEHLHTDEEIRLIIEGSGYFDVRDHDDRWIRIRVEKGDLLIIPAGLYHRFTLDTNNFVKAMRIFSEDPSWIPIPRT